MIRLSSQRRVLRYCSLERSVTVGVPLWLPGRQKQSYSDKDSLLGLLRLGAEAGGCCLLRPESALSVGSGVGEEGDRGGPAVDEGLAAGVEFWVVVGASVFVWRGAITAAGRSLGLRPLFLPVVAPFLTSALIPLFSSTLLLLLETTWVAAARNQFWGRPGNKAVSCRLDPWESLAQLAVFVFFCFSFHSVQTELEMLPVTE